MLYEVITNSAIVKLTKREPKYNVKDEEFFKKVLKAIFQHRNRTIKRALIDSSHEIEIDRDNLKEILEKIESQFDFTERVFKTPPEKIGCLSNLLHDEIANLG